MNKKMIFLLISSVLLSMLLVSCGSLPSKKVSFPTGRFLLQGSKYEGIYYGKDGTWYGFYYGEHVAEGTYHIENDLYVEDANPKTACPTSATYRYSFDGTNLKFELVGEDSCQNRRESYDGVTYVLSQ